VVGGALRTAEDYLPLAGRLARSLTVHLVERRGRGASGPQGPDYALAKEVEDLLAVRAETGARLAFGHSYGGLVVLEAARSASTLSTTPFPMPHWKRWMASTTSDPKGRRPRSWPSGRSPSSTDDAARPGQRS
jgi:pimeloyl-ACP methyl ester carboxylesterase